MIWKPLATALVLSALLLCVAHAGAQVPCGYEGWKFTVDPETALGRLHVEGPGNTSMTCRSLTFQAGPSTERYRVTLVDKQVRIEAGQAPCLPAFCKFDPNFNLTGFPDRPSLDPNTFFFQATADLVIRDGPAGATLILEGHAHLLSSGDGRFADIGAERIIVNLQTGRVEIADKNPPPTQNTYIFCPTLLPAGRADSVLSGMQQAGQQPGGGGYR